MSISSVENATLLSATSPLVMMLMNKDFYKPKQAWPWQWVAFTALVRLINQHSQRVWMPGGFSLLLGLECQGDAVTSLQSSAELLIKLRFMINLCEASQMSPPPNVCMYVCDTWKKAWGVSWTCANKHVNHTFSFYSTCYQSCIGWTLSNKSTAMFKGLFNLSTLQFYTQNPT